ncbi:MAG: DUF3592 domain-containing protein [Candidatus Gastranaerophilales bacterium]|nr:DUF3592 domain-containing protein [Candidatus Gastranaerophilales bacterium]
MSNYNEFYTDNQVPEQPDILSFFKKIVAIIFIFIGCFFLLGGFLAYPTINFIQKEFFGIDKEKIQTYTAITGEVIAWERASVDSTDRSKVYVAKYTVNGTDYTISSPISTNTPGLLEPIGKKVEIKYNPNNPDDAFFTYVKGMSLFNNIVKVSVWVTWFFGVVFILAGFLISRINNNKMQIVNISGQNNSNFQ